MRRSIRSVWSRDRAGSSTTVSPSAERPASRMADFTCALATGSTWCTPRSRCPRMTSGGNRSPSRASSTPAHAAERLDHPAHRPPAQRGVAGQHREARHPGQHPGQEPQARARVPAVDHVVGLGEPGGRRHHHLGPLLADPGPEPLHRLPRGVDVLGAQQAAHAGLPLGQRREEQRPVGDRLVPGHLEGAAERAATAAGDGTLQKSASRAARASSRACRAAAGRLGDGRQDAGQVPLEQAGRLGDVGVATRHLPLDVEGEAGEAGHVVHARAGQRAGQRPGLLGRERERAREQVRAGGRPAPPRRRAPRPCRESRARPAPREAPTRGPPLPAGAPSVQTATVPPFQRSALAASYPPRPPNMGCAPTKATRGSPSRCATSTTRSLAPPTSVSTAPSGMARDTGPTSASMTATGVQSTTSSRSESQAPGRPVDGVDDPVGDGPLADLVRAARLRPRARRGRWPSAPRASEAPMRPSPTMPTRRGSLASAPTAHLPPVLGGSSGSARSGRSARAPRR